MSDLNSVVKEKHLINLVLSIIDFENLQWKININEI